MSRITKRAKKEEKMWEKSKSFTLIELLVVIFITGLVAALVIVNVSSARAKARDAKRKADLRSIQTALEIYYEQKGFYPITTSTWDSGGTINADPGCTSIQNIESGTRNSNWIPELVESRILPFLPKDPRPVPQAGEKTYKTACYMYQSDGTTYVLSAWNTVETSIVDVGDSLLSGWF